jgi:hypothetical protein
VKCAEEALQWAAARCMVADKEEEQSTEKMAGVEDTGVAPVEPVVRSSRPCEATEVAGCWHFHTWNLVCKSDR